MLLDDVEVPAGTYVWMRLGLVDDASYIEIDGQQRDLRIPSGAQTGLKINREFNVATGSTTDFTIDFDLRKSVRVTGNGVYVLRPTLRLVNMLEIGSLYGSVDEALILSESCLN